MRTHQRFQIHETLQTQQNSMHNWAHMHKLPHSYPKCRRGRREAFRGSSEEKKVLLVLKPDNKVGGCGGGCERAGVLTSCNTIMSLELYALSLDLKWVQMFTVAYCSVHFTHNASIMRRFGQTLMPRFIMIRRISLLFGINDSHRWAGAF